MTRLLLLLGATLFVVSGAPSGRRLPTLAEVRDGPPTLDLPTAASLLGISRSYGFELARLGTFPCRVITVGTRRRVPRADLLRLLEGEPAGESA